VEVRRGAEMIGESLGWDRTGRPRHAGPLSLRDEPRADAETRSGFNVLTSMSILHKSARTNSMRAIGMATMNTSTTRQPPPEIILPSFR
jgi:hypothetical protein